MASYFFRVEHDLLRSEAFKTLGGSAIKVYLVIGLYSDFGTDWAYPSIRTIARQAGLSRQTVLAAIEELTAAGLLATSKSKGRSTAYRIIRQAARAGRPSPRRREGHGEPSRPARPVQNSLEVARRNWSKIFRGRPPKPVQNLSRRWPNSSARAAPRLGPNENQEREKTQPASRFRERPSASPPRDGCWLLLICRNC